MKDIELPKSLQDYFSKPSVTVAVDAILSLEDDAKSRLPADLTWDEVRAYHSAVLSAHQVRHDYARFLDEVWRSTWGEVTNQHGTFERVAVMDMDHDARPTPRLIWNDGYYVYLKVTDRPRVTTLMTEVWWNAEEGLQTSVMVETEGGTDSDFGARCISDVWQYYWGHEDGWLYSASGVLVTPSIGEHCDVSPIIQAANAAVRALVKE